MFDGNETTNSNKKKEEEKYINERKIGTTFNRVTCKQCTHK